MENIPQAMFGAVLIIIFAVDRFMSPSNHRASTTAARYYAAVITYVSAYLMTYYILTKYPEILRYFEAVSADKMGQLKDSVGQSETKGSAQNGDGHTVFVALLLSLMVPKIPFISAIDKHFRHTLHKLAAIPVEAIRLSQTLARCEVKVDPQDLKFQAELEDRGISELLNKQKCPWQQGLLENAHLMLKLSHWETSGALSRFIHERADQYGRVREQYARVSKMTADALELETIAYDHESSPLRSTTDKLWANLIDEHKALRSELSTFISHGVLASCFHASSRQREIENLGFAYCPSSKSGLSLNQFVMLFVVLGIMSLLPLLGLKILHDGLASLTQNAGQGLDFEERLLLVLRVALSYTLICAAVVLPKQQNLRMFGTSRESEYPYFGYMLSAIAGVAIAVFIGIAFKFLENLDTMDPMYQALTEYFANSYPYLLMSFGFALGLGFLIDWIPPRRISGAAVPIVKSLMMALVMVVCAVLVYFWILANNPGGAPDNDRLTRMLAQGFLIGSFVGYVVPQWYNRQRS